MRAIVQDSYGALDELALGEVDRPTPGVDEVLIRVRAASVHPDGGTSCQDGPRCSG